MLSVDFPTRQCGEIAVESGCVHCDSLADCGALAIRTGESGEGDDAYKFLSSLR